MIKNHLKFIAFLLSSLASVAFADLKVKLHFSPIANLVYQLDCVSTERIRCSSETYEDLWKREFYNTDEDRALLKAWSEINNRYDAETEFEKPNGGSTAGRFEGVRLSTKIRIASFQSADMEDYFNRLDLIVLPKDREKFEKVVRHFYPRFKKWWDRVALPTGSDFAKKTDLLLKKPEISKKIKQYANFYEAQLPKDYIIHFNLFYRPDFKESTSGQQIENYSVAEFLPTEKPVERIDVIIHELCHFFYSSVDDEKFSSMQKKFEATGKVEARGAYNLIDETLAAALGNGMINKLNMDKKRWEKYFSRKLSFYNNYHIDKAAKTIMPWLEDWLKEGKTLYEPTFVEKYVTSLESVFGNELATPKLLLNEMILVADNKFEGKFRDTVKKEFRTSSMYSGQGEWSDVRTLKSFNELPTLSSLLIVHSDNINQLKEKNVIGSDDYDLLKQKIKINKSGVFSFKRNKNVPIFVIVASGYDEAVKFVGKLAGIKEGFVGYSE